ncbi:MAG: GTPase domain-containing protein [Promethearchaeota archaeon]
MDSFKCLLVGPGGVGKTTLRRVFFEQADPMKLIGSTIEPTYGVDSKIYELGASMAIHDLAGQQLDGWLAGEGDIFPGSDLVLCLLDIRDPWERNERVWRGVLQIRDEMCPDAQVGILFHKADLVGLEARGEVEERAREALKGVPRATAHLTSISPEFVVNTFQYLVHLLRKAMKSGGAGAGEVVDMIDVLNQFIEKNSMNLVEVLDRVGTNTTEGRAVLDKLQMEGYLVVKDALNIVEIQEKGKKLIGSIKKRLYHKVQELISPDPTKEFIKGMILADTLGRPMMSYESREGFFESLVVVEGGISDPALISMFLSAITEFGATIDERGVDLIHLNGENFFLISYRVDRVVGIFFLAPDMRFNHGVINAIRTFLSNLYDGFRQAIDTFCDTGNLEGLNAREDEVVEAVKMFNHVLENVVEHDVVFTTGQLLAMLRALESGELEKVDPGDLKKLIFHYIVSSQPGLVDEILAGIDEGAGGEDDDEGS